MLLAAVIAPSSAFAKPTAGDLDPWFGNHGMVTTRCPGHCHANAVVIDAHRRIVAAGEGTNARFGVVRYRPSGDGDRSFGSHGMVTTRFLSPLPVSVATSVATDSHRRIVAAGVNCDVFENSGEPDFPCRFALARYRPSGPLDSSFGSGGKVISSFGTYDWLSSVAIDSQDRIVAGGSHCEAGNCSIIVARYRANGDLDSSFGSGGSVTTHIGSYSQLESVAIDPHGRIVAAGQSSHNGLSEFALARYLPNGDPDGSFGSGGEVTTKFGDDSASARSVMVDNRGRIVAAGYAQHAFALARYRSNGDLDASFGGDGKLATRFGSRSSQANAAAIDSRNRIVLAGQAGQRLALARYTPSGDLDRSFGARGKVTRRFGRGSASPNGAAIDSRDRIVVAGGHTNFVLARFIGYARRR